MKGELVENRIIVWSLPDANKLFSMGYYGKPVGIPKPKFGEIDAPLVLDLMEGIYLLDKKIISIYAEKKKQNYENMLKICRDEYHEFDKKYAVYEHFREKNYIINPGIKFGCDFAVYERGPGIDHAPYLVQVYSASDTMTSTAVVLAGRLATTVRKQFILAIPKLKNGKYTVEMLALDWWKA